MGEKKNIKVVPRHLTDRAGDTPEFTQAFPTLTHRDMGNVFKVSGWLKTLWIRWVMSYVSLELQDHAQHPL
ncbi:hypothetical protein MK852_16625 [Shewanella benthica]|uniref:hypothetical protein n=1 Tax=Shewanella benthica TaxID=43661 RepID=UPI0018791A93|nr:hypothetical protein [Shewanella benthica]MBE7216001.1 hypothetical protein [Shewanella benthica]MCL1063737.1 hypothetical protein [Shewanella benthica]